MYMYAVGGSSFQGTCSLAKQLIKEPIDKMVLTILPEGWSRLPKLSNALYMHYTLTSLSGSRKLHPPLVKKSSVSSFIVFIILVQFKLWTPSVYLMSQELDGKLKTFITDSDKNVSTAF